MTDRPIIFSAPMIRALIEGRKTQTRRVLCQYDPERDPPHAGPFFSGHKVAVWTDREGTPWRYPGAKGSATGDRLWVREAWKPGAWRDDGRVALDYRASPELTRTPWIKLPETADWQTLWPRWTDELSAAGSVADIDGIHHWEPGQSPMRWRPSIHMPRWASRLTLTVTDVRVQRLQDITEADAKAEGIERHGGNFTGYGKDADLWMTATNSFRSLWNSLHGPEAWDANPWVAAISFTVRQGNIDE